MVWHEVEVALSEKRRELVLAGHGTSEKIRKDGLDGAIFGLTTLNYLNISETVLHKLPDEIGNLTNLQTLVLHSNKLDEVSASVFGLGKLKVLDLSNNAIRELSADIGKLAALTTLNVSLNKLEELPDLSKNAKLIALDASNNRLKGFEVVCSKELSSLSELKLNGNVIEVLPCEVNGLSSLKVLDLSSNRIKTIPGEIVDCNKLKEFLLKNNPISDRRLLKLIDQCRTRQVLDYVKQHSARTLAAEPKEKRAAEEPDEADGRKRYRIVVRHFRDGIRIVADERVRSVRPYILACVVHNVAFTPETLRRFIQLQTRMHESVCDQRNSATIATHDLTVVNLNMLNGTMSYTACRSDELRIVPLNRKAEMTGKDLYAKLQQEAEALRKEKKRTNYSGIHKYLYLLKGKADYPCLKLNDTVISFPPITNSDITKISVKSTAIFLEVTSDKSLQMCSDVLDACVREFVQFFERALTVEQVKVVDVDGNLRNVYPSRTDLKFSENFIEVVRDA